MSQGTGYGKTILFGEHFVVYGIPAIAVGLSNKSVVEIKKADKITFSTNARGTSQELSTNAIKRVMNAMKITEPHSVYLGGDLPTFGGLGSSAAFCVGLARAFNEKYKRNLRDQDINNIAYEGEKAFHGNPSGIDNVMATYGGAMLFKRGKSQEENEFEKLKLGATLHCVIGITHIYSPTLKMVEKVRVFRDDDPEQFQNLCDEAGDLVKRGQKALATGDLKLIGELMNENHELLKAIGVSIEENDKIVEVALKNGALSAKVTGGGGGGCCLILAQDEKSAKKIESAVKKEGFGAFYTRIG